MNRVTSDISGFSHSNKGLKVGDRVSFPVRGIGQMTGIIQRIFDYPSMKREEAKIIGDNGKRYYKQEDSIEKI